MEDGIEGKKERRKEDKGEEWRGRKMCGLPKHTSLIHIFHGHEGTNVSRLREGKNLIERRNIEIMKKDEE